MRAQVRIYVIPEEGPVESHLVDHDKSYEAISGAVKGYIESVPIPTLDGGREPQAVGYVNEEGKFNPDFSINRRATDICIGAIFPGDYIAGPFVISAVDFSTGETISCDELPAKVKLVLEEAGTPLAA